MLRKLKTLCCLLAAVTTLTACSQPEGTIDMYGWQDKLITPTQKEEINNTIESAKDKAQEIVGGVQEATEELSEFVSSGASNTKEVLKNTSTDINELIGYDSKETDGFFVSLGNTIANMIKTWGKEGADKVANNTDKAPDNPDSNTDSNSSPNLSWEVPITDTNLFGDAGKSENGRVKVDFVRVVDGDTIIVTYEGQNIRIRMIGINTPESVHPDEEKNTEEGAVASNFLKELMNGKASLWLEFDIDPDDDYGRALAYIWLSGDGQSIPDDMLNGILLKEKQAEIMTVEPNVKYLEEFRLIGKEGESNE